MRRLATLLLIACAACMVRPSAPTPERSSEVPRPPAPAATEPPRADTSETGPTPGLPFTMVVGGDVTLGYHYEEYFDDQVARGKTRDQMFAYGFKEVAPAIDGTDLFVVNLECPFTDRGEKIPKNFNFRARPEFVSSLVAGRVDVVSLANNHLMDYGPVGLMDTIAALDEAKIPHFGAGMNLAEARKPLILEKNGVKVAFLGYFFLGDHNIEPREVHATDTTPGVAGHPDDVEAMEKMLRDDILAAKGKADLVIPFFHWGRENVHDLQPYQVRLATAAVEAGAATVLGSHPHVLQGIELKNGVPVLYSFGNFVFGGNWNPRKKQSALWKARFSAGGYLSSEVVPMHTDRFPEYPMQPYLLTGEPAESVLRNLAEYSRGFERTLPELERYRAEPPSPQVKR